MPSYLVMVTNQCGYVLIKTVHWTTACKFATCNHTQVKQLHLNLQSLASTSLNVMQDHLTMFNLKSADDLLQIKHIIRYYWL